MKQQTDCIETEEELLMVWKKYAERLFNDERPSTCREPPTENLSGPSIMRREVKYAFRITQIRKTGPDEMNSEAITLLGEGNMEILVKILNRNYNTGYILREWLRPSFIMIPKTASKCKERR